MPKKILLADDSITIQKVVELTFSDGDYEVTAVNNGAKAIQKLSEMRPDIILSDIIMPEKNGYEVCEFVKSHPDYRTIPVVLLTGTFEPFDPDRADKAGCDAVVTKPFESQSLIHKVEELIETARASAPAPQPVAAPAPPPPPPPAPEPSPWMEEPAAPVAAAPPPPPPPPEAPPVHDTDIFGAPPPPEAFSGETRAFPKMNFEGMAKEAATEKIPAQPSAPSPFAEQPPLGGGGETRAFPRMNFEEMQRVAPPAPPEPPATPAPPAAPQPEAELPFGAPPPADAFSGETRAFPKMSFDDLAAQSAPPVPEETAPPIDERPSSPWDDQPAFSGETKAFPRMTFEDLAAAASQKSAVAPSAPASPWEETPSPAPAWSAPEPPPPPKPEPVAAPEPPMPEPEPPAWAAAPPPPPPPPPAPAPAPVTIAAPVAVPAPVEAAPEPAGAELTDEQVDRIARRVVQLMSDQVVRNIAWEVIPDLAEMVVKERIRQLEGE